VFYIGVDSNLYFFGWFSTWSFRLNLIHLDHSFTPILMCACVPSFHSSEKKTRWCAVIPLLHATRLPSLISTFRYLSFYIVELCRVVPPFCFVFIKLYLFRFFLHRFQKQHKYFEYLVPNNSLCCPIWQEDMNYHIAQMADPVKRDKATMAFTKASSASKKKAPGLSLKAREHAFSSPSELASQYYEPGVVYTFDYFDSFFRADCFHLDLKVGQCNINLYFTQWQQINKHPSRFLLSSASCFCCQ